MLRLLLLPLEIHRGACIYARRAVISPATFFPRSAYITRNNYRRDAVPVTSRVLRLRGTMKNNACPRRRESRQINIYYTSRPRTIDNRMVRMIHQILSLIGGSKSWFSQLFFASIRTRCKLSISANSYESNTKNMRRVYYFNFRIAEYGLLSLR